MTVNDLDDNRTNNEYYYWNGSQRNLHNTHNIISSSNINKNSIIFGKHHRQ